VLHPGETEAKQLLISSGYGGERPGEGPVECADATASATFEGVGLHRMAAWTKTLD